MSGETDLHFDIRGVYGSEQPQTTAVLGSSRPPSFCVCWNFGILDIYTHTYTHKHTYVGVSFISLLRPYQEWGPSPAVASLILFRHAIQSNRSSVTADVNGLWNEIGLAWGHSAKLKYITYILYTTSSEIAIDRLEIFYGSSFLANILFNNLKNSIATFTKYIIIRLQSYYFWYLQTRFSLLFMMQHQVNAINIIVEFE